MTTIPEPSRADRVGFIGLGHMGKPMASNILHAKTFEVVVSGRSRSRVADLEDKGAVWAEDAAALAKLCRTVILMVPDLPQVREVLDGPLGLLASEGDLTIVICSSVGADDLRQLADTVGRETHGRVQFVDAPVSGGTEGASAGTLSIMVGGTPEAVAGVLPVLAACGTPAHLGPLGSGSLAKACNQMIVAATMTAIAEASVIAERSGLDIRALLTLLQGGYAGSRVLETKAERIITHDYTPTGAAAFMKKDLAFAQSSAATTNTSTPQLDTLKHIFDSLVEDGLGDEDLAVVHRWVENQPLSGAKS